MRLCVTCGKPSRGKKCRSCYTSTSATKNRQPCSVCGMPLGRIPGVTGRCYDCRFKSASTAVFDECSVAPALPPIPKENDPECIVVTDLHIPYHDPKVLMKACEAAKLLGVRHLIIAGDLIHADLISRFFNCGNSPSVYEELESAGRVVRALTTLFDRVTVIPGNHDQRLERAFSRLKGAEAAMALDVIKNLTGAPDNSGEGLALGTLRAALQSEKVVFHPLPEMVVGKDPGFRIQHPATCSRTPAATEKKMASKHLQHIVSGHNHLAGYTIHESGKFLGCNIGHACDHSKFRYVRESPSHFPKTVPGFCAIICDHDAPQGRVIPLIVHEAWMDLKHLADRLRRARETDAEAS